MLAADDVELLLDGTGRTVLDLQQWPINSVAAVLVDSSRGFSAETAVSTWTIRSEFGHLLASSVWPRGIANIKVQANVGYASVPADLEESIIQLVGYWLESPQISWLSPQSGGDAGSIGTNYVGVMDLPFQIRNVWDHYSIVGGA